VRLPLPGGPQHALAEPPARHRPPPWRRILAALAALLLLNGSLSFNTWWPTPAIWPDHRLSSEFVWAWVLALALAWRGRLTPRALGAIAAVHLLLALGRYADVTAPSLFGRPVSLYWDGAQIPRFLWVTAQERPLWQSAAVVALAAALLWGLWRTLRWGWTTLAREAVPYALRSRWVLGVTALAMALSVANHAGVQATWPLISKPVSPVYWRQAQLLVAAFSSTAQARVLPDRSVVDEALQRPPGQALAALARRDLYLVMLESVGVVTLEDARARAALAPVRERFAADVAASGRVVASARFTSPTFAGGSDLAHLGLLAGLDLKDPMRHDVLLTSDRPTLNTLFRREGYQTFGVYSAVSWPWPERAFYGYDVYLDGPSLGYRGPALGYWVIPDQFTAARFEQLHPREGGAPPRLVFFPTITSHLPFSPVPPFQPDWARVLGPEPFDAADVARTLAERPRWLDMFPDYLRMVDYTYTWIGAWLRQPEPREAVYLFIGDHQPAANVTGEGANWDVPVHLVTRDEALLRRFEARGFVRGMTPGGSSLGPLHALTGVLLEALAGPDATAGRPEAPR
jgi:hypothetical protein